MSRNFLKFYNAEQIHEDKLDSATYLILFSVNNNNGTN